MRSRLDASCPANRRRPVMTADVTIVGGGPNGLLLACELRLAGVRPLLLERLHTRSAAPRANGLVGPRGTGAGIAGPVRASHRSFRACPAVALLPVQRPATGPARPARQPAARPPDAASAHRAGTRRARPRTRRRDPPRARTDRTAPGRRRHPRHPSPAGRLPGPHPLPGRSGRRPQHGPQTGRHRLPRHHRRQLRLPRRTRRHPRRAAGSRHRRTRSARAGHAPSPVRPQPPPWRRAHLRDDAARIGRPPRSHLRVGPAAGRRQHTDDLRRTPGQRPSRPWRRPADGHAGRHQPRLETRRPDPRLGAPRTAGHLPRRASSGQPASPHADPRPDGPDASGSRHHRGPRPAGGTARRPTQPRAHRSPPVRNRHPVRHGPRHRASTGRTVASRPPDAHHPRLETDHRTAARGPARARRPHRKLSYGQGRRRLDGPGGRHHRPVRRPLPAGLRRPRPSRRIPGVGHR
ncbi:FAD-dependent monooxygenase [Streptomyces triculaminicus]|uniref:FAD-dependent monooxygenase n=1 Tax=Streptomyces triculaminicus TaxID=2816232 RepID=A0A939FR88_9ACTN|nr:FAD-dependent monooxygenase [Streptomyces triculaminicus]